MVTTEQSVTTEKAEQKSVKPNNRLGVIGFICMLAGPILLVLANTMQIWIGDFTRLQANIIMGVSLILPAAGFVIGIITLVRWKKTGIWGRALAIVTVVMCNPFFYYIYFIICTIMGVTLAGLPWM